MKIRIPMDFKCLLAGVGALLVSAGALADPVINSIQGTLTDGATVTINGSGFTQKAVAAPLFWWRADFGTKPLPPGRKSDWDKTYFNGTISTAKVAPGSTQSVAWDHTNNGPALSAVKFNSDRLYLFRKLYEDFDVTVNYATRTRVSVSSGTVAVGDLITGQSSGATGRVLQVKGPDSLGRLSLFYDRTSGTINASPRVDFVYDEVMTGPSGTMRNSEGSAQYPTGTYRTFNDKTIRFWDPSLKKSIFIVAQGAIRSDYYITPENTSTTLGRSYFTNPMGQVPFKWVTEEVVYETSDIDVANGTWEFYKDGVVASDKKFILRTSAAPEPYDIVYQKQVSNGALPGSIAYYDTLYIDESWHHVVTCSSPTWSGCTDKEIQIPTSWNDKQITIKINLGGKDSSKQIYLYVVDQDGNANSSGYSLCTKCPLPPSPS